MQKNITNPMTRQHNFFCRRFVGLSVILKHDIFGKEKIVYMNASDLKHIHGTKYLFSRVCKSRIGNPYINGPMLVTNETNKFNDLPDDINYPDREI